VRDVDGFDFAAQPSIDKKQIREIAAGRFTVYTPVWDGGPQKFGRGPIENY
jgi:hypothetical protein